MSSIREAYETLPYPPQAHPLADPARLAAVSRILGVPAADPASSSILEIGCGSGTDLIAMAGRWPGSRFLGIEFSGPDIVSARQLAAEAGLTNIEFRQEDLLNWKPAERYNYLIAYGVFSWVPDEAKDRLLALCREALAPAGIACVSYMTYPGCKQAEAFRDLLNLRTEDRASPDEKVVEAHRVLDFLDRAYGALPGLPHAGFLQREARRIREKDPHFLLHDDLDPQRDPCYLLQFVGWAAEHGLRYVGESEFHTMLPENLPPASARELLAMGLDRLQTEQFMDYVMNRSFRCSLLAGPGAPLTERLDADALRSLNLRAGLSPESGSKPGAAEGKFVTSQGATVSLRSVPLVAFAQALARFGNDFTPYATVLESAVRLAGREFSAEEESRLREDLLSLFGRSQMGLSAWPFAFPARLPARPVLSPAAMAFARRRDRIVSVVHETWIFTPAERAFCLLLDGTRTLPVLQATPEGRALGGNARKLLHGLLATGCLEAG